MLKSIVVTFALFNAVVNGQDGAIKGDANKIQMNVNGASLTLEPDSSSDSTTWNNTFIDGDAVKTTIAEAVKAQIVELASDEYVTQVTQNCASKTELAGRVAHHDAMFITSASMSSVCDYVNTTIRYCPSGEAGITASLFGRGLLVGNPDLYSCVLVVDGKEHIVNASVVILPGQSSAANKQKITCNLPAAYHSTEVTFKGSLYVREAYMTDVPSAVGLDLIQYYNAAPVISTLAMNYVTVAGKTSVLQNDQQTVPFQFEYGDYFDDDEKLEVSFTSLTTNLESFKLDKDTKIGRVAFDKDWMTQFITGDDEDATALATFNMSITDSHGGVTTMTINFNMTLRAYSWNEDGSSKLLNEGVRTEILTRAGGDGGTQLEMCFSLKRDGWNAERFHSLCDGKGPLLNILKRSGSDRIFGGYTPVSSSATCRYQYINTIGDVQPGEDGSDRAWMFHIKDATPDTLEIAYTKSRTAIYSCGRYFMTWGTGHDFTCQASRCYCNIGSAYRTTTDNRPPQEWCTGTYSFTANENAFDFYEVYAQTGGDGDDDDY